MYCIALKNFKTLFIISPNKILSMQVPIEHVFFNYLLSTFVMHKKSACYTYIYRSVAEPQLFDAIPAPGRLNFVVSAPTPTPSLGLFFAKFQLLYNLTRLQLQQQKKRSGSLQLYITLVFREPKPKP
jgi:hypothetical protein